MRFTTLYLLWVFLCFCISASSSPNALSEFSDAHGSGFTVNQTSEERRYLLHVPPDIEKSKKPVPLFMLFHGLNDNCDHFLEWTNIKNAADNHKFIVVSMCGSLGWFGIAWNSGTCCGFRDEYKPDDIAFTRRVSEEIKQKFLIDDSKVYAVGFSNGGMMAEILACSQSDIFSGVVSVAGVVELRPGNLGGLKRCDHLLYAAEKRPNVLMIHGEKDGMVPWEGSKWLSFPTQIDNLKSWLDRNGCAPKASKITFNSKMFYGQLWENCTTATVFGTNAVSKVEMIRWNDGGHHWPNSDELETYHYAVHWLLGIDQ